MTNVSGVFVNPVGAREPLDLGGTMPTEISAVKIFISYSHKDETYREELIKHLAVLRREGVIQLWHDRMISPGDDWAGNIDSELLAADIVLLLVSSDFLASDYCYDKEMTKALELHSSRQTRVVPIIVRPCDWKKAAIGKLQALPRDARPVSTWDNVDEAWSDVALSLRTLATRGEGKKQPESETPTADDPTQMEKQKQNHPIPIPDSHPQSGDSKDKEDFKAEYRKNLIQELSAELARLKVETVKTALKNGFDHLKAMEQDECHGLLAEALVKKDVPNAVLALRSAYLTMERTDLEKHEAAEAWECGLRLMGLMLLGSIDLGWLYKHRYQVDPYSEKFELVVQTFSLLGTEIAFAALNKLWPRFSEAIEYEKLKGQYSHTLTIDSGIVPEAFVTTIKKILFKKMNPSQKIPEFDKPTHNGFLNAAIENRIIEKHQPYIVIDQQIASGQEPLVREVQQIIKRDIPKLAILPVSLDGEGTVVLGEIDLQIHVAEFFASKMKFMQQFA